MTSPDSQNRDGASRASGAISKIISNLHVLLILAISKVAAFVVTVVIARSFDKEDAGVLFFITGLVVLSASFTTMGLSAAANYYYARNLARRRSGRNYQALTLSLLVAIVPSVFFGLFSLTMPMGEGISPLIAALICGICCYFATFRQVAKAFLAVDGKRFWSLVHDSVIFNLALIALIFVLPSSSVTTALIAVLIASVASGLMAFIAAAQSIREREPALKAGLPPMRYGRILLAISIPSMIAQAGGVLLNKMDVLMIGPLAGPIAVSDYSVAIRLTYITTAAGEVLLAIYATTLARLGAQRDPVKQWTVLKKVTALQMAQIGITTVPILVFASPIIELAYGPEFLTALTPFLILQAGKVLTAAFAPALIVFTSLGMNRELAKNALICAGINLALNFALIPLWGATGAALATMIVLAIMSGKYTQLALKVRAAAHATATKQAGAGLQ